MLTKIQLQNLGQTSANIVFLQVWSKETKELYLVSYEMCEHMSSYMCSHVLPTRARTYFLHVRARYLFVRARLLFKNVRPGQLKREEKHKSS